MKPSLLGKNQLGSTPLPLGKAQEWVLDMVVGLPAHDGFDAFLSIIDPYSGFRLAFPCTINITAKKVVTILQLYVIQIFGIPKRFSSDGGPNLLIAKDFTDFLSFHNIEKKIGLPHSAKSHGRIEISNKTVCELLRILSEQHQVTWPRLLHYTVLCLNSRPYKHLNDLSPFEVMFNLKHRNLKEQIDFKVDLLSIADHKLLFNNLDRRIARLVQEAERTLQQQNSKASPNRIGPAYSKDHLV